MKDRRNIQLIGINIYIKTLQLQHDYFIDFMSVFVSGLNALGHNQIRKFGLLGDE